MKNNKLSIIKKAAMVMGAFLLLTQPTVAATVGVIDPHNVGNHFAAFVHAPTGTAGSERINFGLFASVPSANITISGGSLHGYAWSPIAGWIVLNCANTTSGCTTGNQNFKVAVSNTGVLSGYAWGQQTGWINFGPFNNNGTAQVMIASNGLFTGTTGAAGYAWNQKYGWIVFDCSNNATCTETDYGVNPPTPPVTPPSSGGTISGGGFIPVTNPQQVPPEQSEPGVVTIPETLPPATNPSEGIPTISNTVPSNTTPGVPSNGSSSVSLPTEPTTAPSGMVTTTTTTQTTTDTFITKTKKTITRKVHKVIMFVKDTFKSPAARPTLFGLLFILFLLLLRFYKVIK